MSARVAAQGRDRHDGRAPTDARRHDDRPVAAAHRAARAGGRLIDRPTRAVAERLYPRSREEERSP